MGAVLGGLITGGKPKEWVKGAAVGSVVGQTADSERRAAGADGPQEAKVANDKEATAMEKDSPVLREMVSTKAHKSGKFTVVEQTRKDEIKDQMDNEMDGDYAESSLIQRGELTTAKYSAFGTITRFETDRTQKGLSVVGGSETVIMEMTLDLRVVDNTVGTIVCSDQVTGKISTGTSQAGFMGFGSASENQGAIGELLDNLAQNVVAKIVTTLYPIKIISVNVDEKVVMISAGEALVSVGNRLAVYAQGAQVVDPDSGEVLGNEESTVGEVRVIETQARFSKCEIVIPLQRVQDIQVGQVCRPLEAVESGQAPESKPKFTF